MPQDLFEPKKIFTPKMFSLWTKLFLDSTSLDLNFVEQKIYVFLFYLLWFNLIKKNKNNTIFMGFDSIEIKVNK